MFCLLKVSAMKCGLLPLCREAMIVGDVSYFDYAGSLTEQEDKDHLVRALGPMNKVRFFLIRPCCESRRSRATIDRDFQMESKNF